MKLRTLCTLKLGSRKHKNHKRVGLNFDMGDRVFKMEVPATVNNECRCLETEYPQLEYLGR